MIIFVTRQIPEAGIKLLQAAGHMVDVSTKNGVLTKSELIGALKQKKYDAVLCLLTDKIDGEVMDAVPTAKIFANYAVGFDNVDLAAAKQRGVLISNTPEVLTNTVAEHTMALMLAVARRVVEGDRFLRAGSYQGWAPMMYLGTDLSGKTLGILGAGRIGRTVARMAHQGFGMNIAYYDVAKNDQIEKECGATYHSTVEELLPSADFVSVHVPLLPTTKHLMNATRFALMKRSAYLVNTSRGPVIDEVALVQALTGGMIKGAGLDVFENEPALAPGLAKLENVVITPHIASASEETRSAMAEVAAKNIVAALKGEAPPNAVAAS